MAARSPASLETLSCRAAVDVLSRGCPVDLVLPWPVRQRLVEEVVMGGRLYAPLQMVLFEALLTPDVRRLSLRQVRCWYRHRLVRLLCSGRAAGLRILRLEDLAWLLARPIAAGSVAVALRALPHLRAVSLRYVCHDDMLSSLGAACPGLRLLDVHGSQAVTDTGLRRLCLRKAKRGLSSLLCGCCLDDAVDYDTSLPFCWRSCVMRCAAKNACCTSLRLVDLAGTSVTQSGLHLLHMCATSSVIYFSDAISYTSRS